MATVSSNDRTRAAPNPIKATFYLRLIVVVAVFIVMAIWMNHWTRGDMGVGAKTIEMAREEWGIGALAVCMVIYILLLSLPFVPGVELGILLMCVFGKEGIIVVYIATIAGLMIAFLMGRMLPKRWVDSRLKRLGFSQPCENRSDALIFMLDKFLRNKNRLRALFFSVIQLEVLFKI